VIEGLDLTGKKVQLDLADLPARIMQHELDHLEGTMIHQRISPISKLTIRRRLKELETAFQHSPA
jgi:peptide deformylase